MKFHHSDYSCVILETIIYLEYRIEIFHSPFSSIFNLLDNKIDKIHICIYGDQGTFGMRTNRY